MLYFRKMNVLAIKWLTDYFNICIPAIILIIRKNKEVIEMQQNKRTMDCMFSRSSEIRLNCAE